MKVEVDALELAQLVMRAEKANSTPASLSSDILLHSQFNAWEARNVMLKLALDTAKARAQDVNDRLNADNQDLMRRLEHRGTVVDSLQDRNQQLRNEAVRLTMAATRLTDEKEALRKEAERKDTENRRLRMENAALQATIESREKMHSWQEVEGDE